MSAQSQEKILLRKALVLIPTEKSNGRELHGHRLAKALRSLGMLVDIRHISEPIVGIYDWCALTDMSLKAEAASFRILDQQCRTITSCFFDRFGVPSYEDTRRFCRAQAIETILHIGLHDQSAAFGSRSSPSYRFISNGLTNSEQESVRREKPDERERSIPWVFVGDALADRVALVNRLISRVDPRGFFNLPRLSKGAPNPSQTLSPRQYEDVLRQCRYHILFAQDQSFYLESEQFRMSLLTGCVPIQVVSDRTEVSPSLPFDYLVFRESEVAEKLRDADFHELRHRFRAEFLGLPSSARGIAKFLSLHFLLSAHEDNSVRAA